MTGLQQLRIKDGLNDVLVIEVNASVRHHSTAPWKRGRKLTGPIAMRILVTRRKLNICSAEKRATGIKSPSTNGNEA